MGVQLIYLLPYSSDLNPAGKSLWEFFAELKAFI